MFYHLQNYNIIPVWLLLILLFASSVIESKSVQQSITEDEQICVEKYLCCLKRNDTCVKWCLDVKTCEIVKSNSIDLNTEKSTVIATHQPTETNNNNEYNSTRLPLNGTAEPNQDGKLPPLGPRFVIQAPKVCGNGKQVDNSGQCREVW